jgi:hypothetical protein
VTVKSKRFLPGRGMDIDGIDQRTVDIKDNRFDQHRLHFTTGNLPGISSEHAPADSVFHSEADFQNYLVVRDFAVRDFSPLLFYLEPR